MSPLLKNLITALCITFLLGVVYFFTIGSSVDDMGDDTEGISNQIASDLALKTEKILLDTQLLDTYLEDISIFEDVRFRALKDFRVEIEDVETGRANPFDPVR
jgi:hypothetical protein